MEYPCEIIQDLIPVFIQGESSEETTEAIDWHVRECPGCADYYCWMFELMAQDVDKTERQNSQSAFRMLKKGLLWIRETGRRLLKRLAAWEVEV